MVLPEVVGGLIPVASVSEFVALCDEVAVFICDEAAVEVVRVGVHQMLVKGVVLSEANFIHVFVSLYAWFAVYAVHDAEIVVAGGDTVPGLSGLLEVADVLVA